MVRSLNDLDLKYLTLLNQNLLTEGFDSEIQPLLSDDNKGSSL